MASGGTAVAPCLGMNTNIGNAAGWTTSYRALFGSRPFEILVRSQSGVNVAHAFDLQADGSTKREIPMEFLGNTESIAFRGAYDYLTGCYGLARNGGFLTPSMLRTAGT